MNPLSFAFEPQFRHQQTLSSGITNTTTSQKVPMGSASYMSPKVGGGGGGGGGGGVFVVVP